jgi:hypothetical protein
VDGSGEFLEAVRLADDGADANAGDERGTNIEHREEDDRCIGETTAQDMGGFDAVETRETKVENNESGLEFAGLVDGVEAVNSFGTDGVARLLKSHAQDFTSRRVVVSDENALTH